MNDVEVEVRCPHHYGSDLSPERCECCGGRSGVRSKSGDRLNVEATLADPAAVLAQLLEAEFRKADDEMKLYRSNVASPEWSRANERRRAAQRLSNLLAAPAERAET